MELYLHSAYVNMASCLLRHRANFTSITDCHFCVTDYMFTDVTLCMELLSNLK
jgi:hypothetical protein